ncbi:hypothetical protein PLESTM_001828000, partial [Pleodorina starrii]
GAVSGAASFSLPGPLMQQYTPPGATDGGGRWPARLSQHPAAAHGQQQQLRNAGGLPTARPLRPPVL